MHYFLNIGSNLGNRKLNISRALRALEENFGYFETSSIVESRPWGFVSDNLFANIAVMIVSDREPSEILNIIHEIENRYNKSAHRDSEGGYSDRELDIDIMAIDDMVIDTPELTVPHRHLAERTFFLGPFSELAPLWRHPVTGLTAAEMNSALETRKDEQ